MTWQQKLEALYWVAGILVALFAGLSLKQLSILKTDIRTRNDRAAKEKAIECANEWANIQQDIRPFIDACAERGLPMAYTGAVNDFMYSSLIEPFKSEADLKEKVIGWAKPINHLEAVAAAFTKRVAHEPTGFEIMGRDYCLCVKALYDVIAANRRHQVMPLYSNIVELYGIWAPKMKVAELKNELANAKIKELAPAIGCEPDN